MKCINWKSYKKVGREYVLTYEDSNVQRCTEVAFYHLYHRYVYNAKGYKVKDESHYNGTRTLTVYYEVSGDRYKYEYLIKE